MLTKKRRKGHPRPSLLALAYNILGFVGKEFTKPAHEHHLQVLPARPSLVPAN
jgi:hypothetical protein